MIMWHVLLASVFIVTPLGFAQSIEYTADWESLKDYPAPEWYEDAKFGIFIHWGPYSVPGWVPFGYAEWYPHRLYNNSKTQEYHKKTFGPLSEVGYKDLIPMFKAEKWDPEAWADLFAKAGARYIVPVAEHHDGFAMWDSELTTWDAAERGPRRDIIGDLEKACRARGLRYGPSYHRERHPSYFTREKYLVESEPWPAIVEEIKRMPEAAELYGPFQYDDAFIADYVARWKEIQGKYRPDFMWIDDIPLFYWDKESMNHPQAKKFRQACAGMIADYFNAAQKWGKEVYLNNKGRHANWPVQLGAKSMDNMDISHFPVPNWENPATIAKSYGYNRRDEETGAYKSSTQLVHLLVDVVSKNGSLLLNIGPKADGTIPQAQAQRLLDMGQWLKVNGEAIYATRCWKTFGEGITQGKNEKATGMRFTRSKDGKTVYAILVECPEQSVTLKSFRGQNITGVTLLGIDALLRWSVETNGLTVDLPETKPCKHAYVLKVAVDKKKKTATKPQTEDSSQDSWVVDGQEAWLEARDTAENLEIKDGLVEPTQDTSQFTSIIKRYKKKHKPAAISFKQSPVWENWEAVPNVGPKHTWDAPVFLPVADKDYWFLGRCTKKDENGNMVPGYHAWHSTDMKTWKHCGPVTDARSTWVTTAEYVDGTFYIYYDHPNDEDPHLFLDKDLTDGELGKDMGMVFADPSHGSDCAILRDEDGTFHLIYENWSYMNARTHSWDGPVGGHAVSPDGIHDFKILDPAVDDRTMPTGRFATFDHPFNPVKMKYEIPEPEQNAYGDYTAIKIGSQYYLFCDYHPAGDRIRIGRWTSGGLNEQFTWCGELGMGHPDPTVGFAEGRFYLIVQSGDNDYVSPGPWVDGVESRVGVDTSGDGKIDQWTDWQAVKETYTKKPGFARIVETTPASIDLNSLPAGYGFKYEFKLTDTTENQSKPIMQQVILSFN